MPSQLKKRKKELYKVFKKSRGVNLYGGPGGMPVNVCGEVWNVALSPGNTYVASNGVSGQQVEHFRSYSFDRNKELLKVENAQYMGNGWMTNPDNTQVVESVEEIDWLIGLVAVTSNVKGWRDDLRYDIPFPSK